jgi:hypothetical protein
MVAPDGTLSIYYGDLISSCREVKEQMAVTAFSGVVDFEVYLLMTMKPRLSLADAQGLFDTKVAQAGLSLNVARRIYDRISEALSEEMSRFRDIKAVLGVDDDANSLKYSSVLWPGFEFIVQADMNGLLESAGYMHLERCALGAQSPTDLAAWSVDVAEFTERFGPVIQREKRPSFDKVLPAFEEYEFSWNGDRYGAGFLWGLFLSSSAYWD